MRLTKEFTTLKIMGVTNVSHFIIIAITIITYPGETALLQCDFAHSCLPIYNNLKLIFEEHHLSDQNSIMSTLCSMSHDLKDCMKKTSRRCRGDLNYHFTEKLVRDLTSNIGVGKNCQGSHVRGSNSTHEGNISRHHHNILENGEFSGSHRNGMGGSRSTRVFSPNDPCTPKFKTDPGVGCALFGLTNLKSFSDKLNHTEINYCSLSGAWSLVDTPHFAVQITNKGGLSPLPKDITATTLITVIIKQNECSQRKTYQATFDEVPGMFSDGYTTAGNNVHIETIVESEHVQIHFPYISTTINVIKVLDKIPIPSLTVTIKMPEPVANSLISDPKRLRGLPLCFYGCPRTATITRQPSNSKSSNNYYKSKCPNPLSAQLKSVDDKPQSDSVNVENTEFSSSLSAEFLSQSETKFFSNSDFENQQKRSQRSSTNGGGGGGSGGNNEGSGSSTNTAVICESLKKASEILVDTVLTKKLDFPGEENSYDMNDSNGFINVMTSAAALTSQSSPLIRFHNYFHLLGLFVFLFFTNNS